MSGPVKARGPCPHAVVEGICWQCTPDAEVLRQAGAALLRGVKMTGKAYEGIGTELERMAVELERQESAAANFERIEGTAKLTEWPPAGTETEDPLERPATLLTAAHEEAMRKWWSYPCSFGFEYHGEMTEEAMRDILGIPASMDLEAPGDHELEDVELEP